MTKSLAYQPTPTAWTITIALLKDKKRRRLEEKRGEGRRRQRRGGRRKIGRGEERWGTLFPEDF